MQRRTLLAVLMTVGLGWWVGQTAVAQEKSADTPDRTFVQQASSGGLAEVQLGKLATERAASAEVRQFGQRMVADHTQANTALATLAQAKNLPMATAMDPQHQAMAAKLATLEGAAFDREYLAGQVTDHEQTVALFTSYAKDGQDAELKAFAAKTLPTVQEHLQLVRALATK